MKIEVNKSLINYNTCKINVSANNFIEVSKTIEIDKITETIKNLPKPIYILGMGANTLFTNNFKGTIIHLNTKGIHLEFENDKYVLLKVQSGEIWDDFATYCVENNYYGVENLVAIPSSIGAVAIQNIGAYGTEASDIIHEVYYTDIKNGKNIILSNKECNFSYRNSIFKNKLKDRIIITSVIFKLSKTASFKLEYGQIQNELKINNITNPQLIDIANTIRNIRKSKLPDYKIHGNAGSFFKNPIVGIDKFKILKNKFPKMVSYKINDNTYKIAAGWLIDNAGLKGYSIGDAMVHTNQALVIINIGNASGNNFKDLSKYIQNKINKLYNIQLHPEVIIL